MPADHRGIGEQPVERHQGRDAGEDREEDVEAHPRGDRDDAVLRHIAVDAPKNILPSSLRNFGGRHGPAATPIVANPFCAGFRLERLPATREAEDEESDDRGRSRERRSDEVFGNG